MKNVISSLALVVLFSVSMNAQQEDPKAKKATASATTAKAEVKESKKECKEGKKAGCCMAKKA